MRTLRLAVCGCLFAFTSPQDLMADSFTNSLGQIFILCPAGSFIMGSTEGEAWRGRDERAHLISITDAFYIMATEVTQAQWRQLMGDNPSYFADCASCPVERVSWHDAQRFVATLNAKEKTDGYALPTEAQWEYAARAGNDGPVAQTAESGEYSVDCVEYAELDEVGWHCANSEYRSHPVTLKQANDWGLYDMQGNVWEWVEDWYGQYPDQESVDPPGPRRGLVKVLRGGSWFDRPQECRIANRFTSCEEDRNIHMGFRLIKRP